MTKLLTEPVPLELLTLDTGIFRQIRAPTINAEEYNDRIARAETGTVGYVVDDPGVCLIIEEDGDLWRWKLCDAELYEAAREEHQWLRDVPQIFLRGGQA